MCPIYVPWKQICMILFTHNVGLAHKLRCLPGMHRSIGNQSQSADNGPIGFDRSSQNRSKQADQMMFQYRDSASTACIPTFQTQVS